MKNGECTLVSFLLLFLISLYTTATFYSLTSRSSFSLQTPTSRTLPPEVQKDILSQEVKESDSFASIDALLLNADDDDVYVEPESCELSSSSANPINAQGCPTRPYHFYAFPKVVALASFPGSGNTWLRHLVERGLGVWTGSVYLDELLVNEFPGELCLNASRVALTKTHDPWCPVFQRQLALRQDKNYAFPFHASILLLRSPTKSLLSFFHLVSTEFNHTGLAPAVYFTSSRFKDFVATNGPCWAYHTQHYLVKQESAHVWRDKANRPVLLVYYEDLVKDTQATLVRVFGFLERIQGIQLNPENAARCAVMSAENESMSNFHRKPRMDGRDPWREVKMRIGSLTAGEFMCAFAVNKTFFHEAWCGDEVK